MNNTVNYEFRMSDGTIIARMSPDKVALVEQTDTGEKELEVYADWRDALKKLGGEKLEGDFAYGDKEMVSAMEGAFNGKAHPVKPDPKAAKNGRAKKGEKDTQVLAGELISGIVVELTPDQIKVGKNPRGETIGVEDIAQSIRRNGQLQNIVVGPPDKNGKHELYAGFRRVAAAEHNQKSFPNKPEWYTLRALVYEGNKRIAGLAENLHRINMNPMAIARQYNEMVEVDGMQQKEVAKLMGVLPTEVSNYMSLLNLPKRAQELLEEGKITYSIALKLAKMTEEDRKAALANIREQVTQAEETGHKGRQARKTVVDESAVHSAVLEARKGRRGDEEEDEEEDGGEEEAQAAEPADTKLRWTRKAIDDFLDENILPGAPPPIVFIFTRIKKMFDGKLKESTCRKQIMDYAKSLKETAGSR